jgi:signal transduction histidine kinase
MPAQLSLTRDLTTLLRLAAIGGASVIIVTLLTITWQLAARFDADARLNTQNMVAGGVQAQRMANKTVTRDYAVWTDAHDAVQAGDLAWLDSNIGAGAYVTGTMDAVVLAGGPLPRVLGWSAPSLGAVSAFDHDALARTAATLVAQRGHAPGQPPVSSFVRTGDILWLVSSTWITRAEDDEGGQMAPPAWPTSQLALLTVAMAVNDGFVARMGELFQIDGLGIATDPPLTGDSFALVGVDGPVGYLVWPLPRPGRAALASLAAPIVIAVSLSMMALAFGIIAIRRLADRLARALDASRAADRTKAEFIASLSHELRTPMNGIVGMLELLQATDLTPDQAEFVGIALASAETQVEMIEHLLAFGQIESGRLHLSLAAISPAALIHEVVELARPAARAKGLALTLTTDARARDALLGDRLALRQIAVNLIGNAVKFTPSGGVRVTLAVRDELGGRRMTLTVDDSGPGVPPGDRLRIFETFEQGDSSATRAAGGVGLGLAISRRLADLMGGTLRLKDKPTPGACFVFEAVFDLPTSQTRPHEVAA